MTDLGVPERMLSVGAVATRASSADRPAQRFGDHPAASGDDRGRPPQPLVTMVASMASHVPLVDYLVLGDRSASGRPRVHDLRCPLLRPPQRLRQLRRHRRSARPTSPPTARFARSRSSPSPRRACRCRSCRRSSTATAPACAATSSTSSRTPSTSRSGMKVRLATYSLGTDDDGTEAIGFGFEPA